MQADNVTELQETLANVLGYLDLLLQMKEKAKKLHTKSAAFDAAEIILKTRQAESMQWNEAYV
jgi:glycine cleavage system regulatory protein